MAKKNKKTQPSKTSPLPTGKNDTKPIERYSTPSTTASKVNPSHRAIPASPLPRPVQKYPHIRPSGPGTNPANLTPAERLKRVKGIYWITGIGVYALTSYGVYLYIQYQKAVKLHQEDEKQYGLGLKERPEIDTLEVYQKISGKYDSDVGFSEWCLGMPLLRRYMLWGLQGNILEASAGTGRNNKYYSLRKCKSITMVDNSSKMLEIAKSDFEYRYPKYGRIAFAAQDAKQPINSPSGEGFDRVIQTMGLCSQKSPVETLQNLEKHCKPDGKIILLEHGRSHYTWLNNILDAYVIDHAKNWGCFWNRDIGKLLEESGLVVNKISRFHFGTTWLIEASPSQRTPATDKEPETGT